jgi:hypothetical protein
VSAPIQTPPPCRNWKVEPYTVSPETRLLQERARQHQPPLLSLHAKGENAGKNKPIFTIAPLRPSVAAGGNRGFPGRPA